MQLTIAVKAAVTVHGIPALGHQPALPGASAVRRTRASVAVKPAVTTTVKAPVTVVTSVSVGW